MKRNSFVIFIFLLFLLLIFFKVSWQKIDPDFGWHLMMGKLILSKGIPGMDPFSYTMPSYPFVDHEWLTNVILAVFYPKIGLLGLNISFTLLALLSLLLQAVLSSSKWNSVLVFLTVSALNPYFGIRPQIISWFMFSLLLVLLQRKFRKISNFFLPILFLLWVNLHGGFALGIIFMGIHLVLTVIEENKINYTDLIIYICCIVVTFINPYSYRIWWEVMTVTSDISLRWSIQEWLPTLSFFNFGFFVLLAFSGVLTFLTWKSFSRIERIFYLLFLVYSLLSLRNAPFWIILIYPLTVKAISYFLKQIKKIPYGTVRFEKAYTFLLYFIIIGGFCQILSDFIFPGSYTDQSFYPQQALQYLKRHPVSGEIFSEYSWGGYIIWNLPDKKVFIDGRMPSWRRDDAPENESKYSFRDYQDVLSGKTSFASVINKYDIRTVLVMTSRIDGEPKSFRLLKYFGIKSKNKSFQELMNSAGMRMVYKDKIAVVYRR